MPFLAVFPKLDVIPVDNPIVEAINFKNLGVSFGKEAQERKKRQWDYPKRDISLKYTWISLADALTLWNFYIARGGSWETFKYFHSAINTYDKEFVTTCNGWQAVFDLPSVNSTDYTLYLDGNPLTEGAFFGDQDYRFGAFQGDNGEDAVGLTVIPEVGSLLTWDFTGNLVQRCRFEDDSQSFETFYNRLSKVGIKIKGLLLAYQFGTPPAVTTTTTTLP